MKLKNILRRGGGGGEHKASSSSSSKKKSSSSSSSSTNNNNINFTDHNDDTNVSNANEIRATNTGSTSSHSDGSFGMVSDVPHGSGIYGDTTRNHDDKATLECMNDVVVAIKPPRKVSKNNNNKNDNNEATNQRTHSSKSKPSASASLPSLDFAEILQAGYSVLSCVAQCRPMSDATANAEIPTVIDPALNEDHHTVGELTLLTIEREEHRREMISAAKERASEITAGIVGMGFTTTAAANAPTTSGYDVSRQRTIGSRAAQTSSAPMNHHQQHQQPPRVHATIGSLLVGNQNKPLSASVRNRDNMQIKAQALLEKANLHNNVVQMQHSVDSASFNMPPINSDTVCVAKEAPPGETFIGRYGAQPSLSDDDGEQSSGDENECDSIDGQIGQW